MAYTTTTILCGKKDAIQVEQAGNSSINIYFGNCAVKLTATTPIVMERVLDSLCTGLGAIRGKGVLVRVDNDIEGEDDED